MNALRYILARLAEPSTAAGLGVFAVGVGMDPAKVGALVPWLTMGAGAAAALLPERKGQ